MQQTTMQLQYNNANSGIAVSSVVRRKDGQAINMKVRKLNGLLEEDLALNGIDVIDDNSTQYSDLWTDGLYVDEGEGGLVLSSEKNEVASSNVRNRKGNGLKTAFLNIVSLRKNRNELKVVLNDNEIGIIGLRETRLSKTVRDSNVNMAITFTGMTVTVTAEEWQFTLRKAYLNRP